MTFLYTDSTNSSLAGSRFIATDQAGEPLLTMKFSVFKKSFMYGRSGPWTYEWLYDTRLEHYRGPSNAASLSLSGRNTPWPTTMDLRNYTFDGSARIELLILIRVNRAWNVAKDDGEHQQNSEHQKTFNQVHRVGLAKTRSQSWQNLYTALKTALQPQKGSLSGTYSVEHMSSSKLRLFIWMWEEQKENFNLSKWKPRPARRRFNAYPLNIF